MKRIALLVLGVMAFSGSMLAQAPDDAIATAVLALPENLRAEATVIKWKPDFTYDTLRTGTNGLVCYDRSGFPGQRPFSIECTAMGNLEREAQNLKAEAQGAGDRAKSEAVLNEMEKNGTRAKPVYGSVWYHFAGPSREQARMHMTVALPGATAQSTGLPDKRTADTVWIMNAGTSTAHLMIPGE
jgi:hypothetical protein